MRITDEEVKHIARLSRLEFDEEGRKQMAEHMGAVLDYFKMLDSVDTSAVAPTAHILDKVNVLREDVAVCDRPSRETLLQNAPETEDGAYVVPRVLE